MSRKNTRLPRRNRCRARPRTRSRPEPRTHVELVPMISVAPAVRGRAAHAGGSTARASRGIVAGTARTHVRRPMAGSARTSSAESAVHGDEDRRTMVLDQENHELRRLGVARVAPDQVDAAGSFVEGLARAK